LYQILHELSKEFNGGAPIYNSLADPTDNKHELAQSLKVIHDKFLLSFRKEQPEFPGINPGLQISTAPRSSSITASGISRGSVSKNDGVYNIEEEVDDDQISPKSLSVAQKKQLDQLEQAQEALEKSIKSSSELTNMSSFLKTQENDFKDEFKKKNCNNV
jgi:hypothetical protein